MSANTQEKGASRQTESKAQGGKEDEAISASKDAELAARLEDPVGQARAMASPEQSRAADIRREKQRQQQAAKRAFPNPLDIPIKAGRAARRALERLAGSDKEVSQLISDGAIGGYLQPSGRLARTCTGPDGGARL
jgi:hypothetical protein